MSSSKRATVHFELRLYKALMLKAAQTKKSISDLVNLAVRLNLVEDDEDLQAFEIRKKEPSLLFDNVLKDLKRSGKL